MKINEYSSINKTGSAAKKKNVSSAADGSFFDLLSAGEAEAAAQTTPAVDVAPAGAMDALLSLQEIPNNEISKRQAMQEGKGALETLEKLRLGLLSGSISGNMLAKLGDISSLKKQSFNDANLDNIIRDIELRAAVELAKLERASKDA